MPSLLHLLGFLFTLLNILNVAASSPALRSHPLSSRQLPRRTHQEATKALSTRTPPRTLASTPSLPSISPQTGSVFISSFLTAAMLYPLDLLRGLKMQSPGAATGTLVSKFIKDFGPLGIFKQGIVPEVSRATVMRGVKFALYPQIHEKLFDREPKDGTSSTRVAAAALTSIPEVLLIMPLEVSKVLLTTDVTNKYSNSMIKAIRATPLTKQLTGWVGVQYRQMSWGCAYFATIGPWRSVVDKFMGEDEETSGKKMAKNLLSGFAAGVTGACLNTPGDTIRSVVMKQNLVNGVNTNFLATGRAIIKEKGASSLYSGFGAKAAHLGGGGALMALLGPICKEALEKRQSGVKEE